MTAAIRVIIVDDHALFRRGLAEVLAEDERIELIGQAESGPEGVEISTELKPDVILMDVHMPGGGGVAAVKQLKQISDTPILMLTVSEKDEDLLGAIQAGADGYLLKNVEPDELIASIQKLAAGQAILAPEITLTVMRAAVSSKQIGDGLRLSPRETEVLDLLSHGASTKEIAAALVISSNTVKTHINKIFKKLGATNRAEAVAKAVSAGLVNINQ